MRKPILEIVFPPVRNYVVSLKTETTFCDLGAFPYTRSSNDQSDRRTRGDTTVTSTY